jgi:hypothetical protein
VSSITIQRRESDRSASAGSKAAGYPIAGALACCIL